MRKVGQVETPVACGVHPAELKELERYVVDNLGLG